MRGKLAVSLSLAAFLLVAQNAAAYHEEMNLERPTLSDVRTALSGDGTRPGLVNGNRPFKAGFRDVVVTNQDASQLPLIALDAAGLPPDSQFKLRGSVEGKPFEMQMQSNEKGHKEARIEGLNFASRQQALNFLETLKDRGISDAKLRGSVEGQPIKGKIEDGKPRFEG